MLISTNRGDEQLTICARVDFAFQVTKLISRIETQMNLNGITMYRFHRQESQ